MELYIILGLACLVFAFLVPLWGRLIYGDHVQEPEDNTKPPEEVEK